jgi:type IV secretion system protein VirD4
MTPTKVLIGQILIVLGIVVAGSWIATEWAATQLGFQARLGLPWFAFDGIPIYHPWRLFEWWYVYESMRRMCSTRAGLLSRQRDFSPR